MNNQMRSHLHEGLEFDVRQHSLDWCNRLLFPINEIRFTSQKLIKKKKRKLRTIRIELILSQPKMTLNIETNGHLLRYTFIVAHMQRDRNQKFVLDRLTNLFQYTDISTLLIYTSSQKMEINMISSKSSQLLNGNSHLFNPNYTNKKSNWNYFYNLSFP